ncbi:NAD(P)/FAD-dependent oxidoreductase [Nocardia sp. CDC153]|uniref:flavin-containing monooxygenase n=1 Tax=Nocardia sp. CDC153 TaxID=3112167 RepID=UPI002DB595A8|nr:NAD(P)/FAD-dependent oxidoreductase [Nocardia sp. CDC153]MEC3956870.1 NAD(P)/FAD-dependent oxidoreductase [Nocardia sp. CDC153]
MTVDEHHDVVIVGAGLSGIGAARRLRAEFPHKTFVILEARATLGGTWNLFRYPGVRSDSDIFTLSYPFKPWRGPDSIADGRAILDYVAEAATESGIDRKIRYHTKVVAAYWNSDTARWTLTLEQTLGTGETVRRTMTCGFLYACAGYYDYDRGYTPEFDGLESFTGTVVHPQFWPEELDCSGQRVVIIGSGATAITLTPALAGEAAHVTMLQRSPTWIFPVPRRDIVADLLRAGLPRRLAHHLIRAKNIAMTGGLYWFCRAYPRAAGTVLRALVLLALRDRRAVAEHFTPTYAPWDQRLCAVVDSDLFTAIRRGAASVVTDRIDSFEPRGVRLRSGRVLDADIVVTATGLQMTVFGGIEFRVDGRTVKMAEEFLWQGAMVTGVPNFAAGIGYANAAWTLRADLNARVVCRVLRHIERNGGVPVAPKLDGPLGERPFLELSSGYIQRSVAEFPRQGDRAPWRAVNYVRDSLAIRRTRLARSLDSVVPHKHPN